MILSVGDQLMAGLYHLHSRFTRAINFVGDHGLVTLVNEEIGAGPRNIVLSELPGDWLTSLEVGQDAIFFDDASHPFTSQRIYDSALKLQRPEAARFSHNLAIFHTFFLEHAAPESLAFLLDRSRLRHFHGFAGHLACHLDAGVSLIARGEVAQGVRAIRGCGVGLTPSGDDFLAGMMIALHVQQQLTGVIRQTLLDTVYDNSKSGNIFTDAFLTMAWRGRLTARIKEGILALAHGEEQEVTGACRRWLAMGETSGADLVTGFLYTLGRQQKSHPPLDLRSDGTLVV